MTIKRVLFIYIPLFLQPFLSHYSVADEPKNNICDANEFRQFDFLPGEWTVNDAKGQLVGHNSIRLILDHCALEEDWRSLHGEQGKSVIFFDINLMQWYQTWIDNRGSALRLQGGLVDGRMVLSGRKDNSDELHEISWQPLGNGQIKQYWRMTKNNGKTWVERFTGYYLPALKSTQ